jgi:hypothetical protein
MTSLDLTPYSLVDEYTFFGGTCYRHLRSKMGDAVFFKALVPSY